MIVEGCGAVGDLRPLARGPVATVYVGRVAGTGAEVAVKMFAKGIDKDTRVGFERERAAMDGLRGLGSVLLVDDTVEDTAGRWGVRMELCEGSLAGRLDSGALAIRQTLAVGSAVATALAAAHRAGVVHGAVTPHNVLYRQSGEIVVADFGLALRQRFPRDALHSLEYTAPETLLDDTHSTASDLYGLGAVLHAALTGAPPFARRVGQQREERIVRVLHEEPPPITTPGVPAELADAVRRLLAKDPDSRPPDATGLVDMFANLRERMPAQADDYDFDSFPAVEPSPAAVDPVSFPPIEWPPAAVDPADPPTEPIRVGRTEIYNFDGTKESTKDSEAGDRRRTRLLAGGLTVAILVAVTLVLVLRGSSGPDRAAAAPPATRSAVTQPVVTQTPDAPPVHVVLAQPADEGTAVDLSWTADGDLDFAVVVAGDHIDTMVLLADRQHTMRVPVDADRGYCFQVRGTDGRHVYTSQPVSIRGAACSP